MSATASGVASYYRRPVPIAAAQLTEYVGAELLRVQQAFQVPFTRTVTAAYSPTLADDVILADATGGTITVTLPDPTRAANKDFYVKRLNSGANAVTVVALGGSTIDGAASSSLAAQWQTKRYRSNGTLWYVLSLL